jgi:hypothetical protein
MGKVDKEAIRIAAEVGAKAAMDRLDEERAKERSERVDRRLHNTKLLLRNFKLFKKHTENAVFEADQLDESVYDILDMMERSSSVGFVDSVKNSVARTAILVRHIEVMLDLYKIYCERSSKPEEARRWRAIKARYIDEDEKTVLDIAEQECVADRTVRRDIEEACEHLAALFFGIDGVKRG